MMAASAGIAKNSACMAVIMNMAAGVAGASAASGIRFEDAGHHMKRLLPFGGVYLARYATCYQTWAASRRRTSFQTAASAAWATWFEIKRARCGTKAAGGGRRGVSPSRVERWL